MNKYKLIGKTIPDAVKQKCQEKILSFKNINDIIKNNLFITPPFQPELDNDKINDMVKSYIENEDYLIFKNKIVVAFIDETKLYLIDGHHRFQMANILYEKNYNNYLICCYFLIKTDEEMRNLFIEINKDSYKNQTYISLCEFTFNIVDTLKVYLKEEYQIYFADKKSKEKYIYTIDEFINKLIENNYINKFKNVEDIKKDLELKNNKFNILINYQDYYLENEDSFYKDEILSIKNSKIYGLKNNNFIDYILDENIIPNHKFKNKKIKISPKLRFEVWRKYYNNNLEGKCPICNNNIGLYLGYHCGHIISEKNNGETNLDNLRPLCSNCNLKMNSTNWDDYIKKIKTHL